MAQNLAWNQCFVDQGEAVALKNDKSMSNYAQIQIFSSDDITIATCSGDIVLARQEFDDYLLVTVDVSPDPEKITVTTSKYIDLDIIVEPGSLIPGHLYNIKVITKSKNESVFGFVNEESAGGIEFFSIIDDVQEVPTVKDSDFEIILQGEDY